MMHWLILIGLLLFISVVMICIMGTIIDGHDTIKLLRAEVLSVQCELDNVKGDLRVKEAQVRYLKDEVQRLDVCEIPL